MLSLSVFGQATTASYHQFTSVEWNFGQNFNDIALLISKRINDRAFVFLASDWLLIWHLLKSLRDKVLLDNCWQWALISHKLYLKSELFPFFVQKRSNQKFQVGNFYDHILFAFKILRVYIQTHISRNQMERPYFFLGSPLVRIFGCQIQIWQQTLLQDYSHKTIAIVFSHKINGKHYVLDLNIKQCFVRIQKWSKSFKFNHLALFCYFKALVVRLKTSAIYSDLMSWI